MPVLPLAAAALLCAAAAPAARPKAPMPQAERQAAIAKATAGRTSASLNLVAVSRTAKRAAAKYATKAKTALGLAPKSGAARRGLPAPADQGIPLAAYLQNELGRKYHRRSEWAGASGAYLPVIDSSRNWQPLGAARFITVHHASGIPSEHPARMIRNIFTGHTDARGRLDASDVGYHFFVDSAGEVWEGRDATRMGTHVGSHPHGLNNIGNLGICGLGSYAHDYPTKRMRQGVVDLCVLICQYYGRPLIVRGHKDWQGINKYNPLGGTDCPGHLEGAVRAARRQLNARWKVLVAENLDDGANAADKEEKAAQERPVKSRKTAPKKKSAPAAARQRAKA